MTQVETYLRLALDCAHRSGISDLFTYAAFIQANLACWRGDRAGLQAALALFTEQAEVMQLARVGEIIARLKAWFWLRLGDLATAVQWADSCGLTLQDTPGYDDFDDYYTLVATRLAQSRHTGDKTVRPALLTMMNKLEEQMVTARHLVGLIEALTLQALVQAALDDPAATATLQRALDLARPGKIMRLFLDWGQPMRLLLARTVSFDPDFVGGLLTAFAAEPTLMTGEETAVVSTAPPSDASPDIHLTPRETEILHLIAAGLSNKQIEENLFISKNTVRTHIKNLYSKLDAGSRTQAIKKAHDLDLL